MALIVFCRVSSSGEDDVGKEVVDDDEAAVAVERHQEQEAPCMELDVRTMSERLSELYFGDALNRDDDDAARSMVEVVDLTSPSPVAKTVGWAAGGSRHVQGHGLGDAVAHDTRWSLSSP